MQKTKADVDGGRRPMKPGDKGRLPKTAKSAGPADAEQSAAERRARERGKYDRSQTQERRRDEQRELLLRAAAEAFAANGFARTSVDHIVRRVGMGRRTFYAHFRDVEHVLLEVFEVGGLALYQRVEQAVSAEDDPAEMIRAGIVAYLTHMAAAAPVSRVIYREAMSLGRTAIRRYDVMRARYVNLWMRGYRQAPETEHLPRPDRLKLYALTAGIEAVALHYIENDEEHRILDAVPALVELGIAAATGGRVAETRRNPRRGK